MFDRGSLTCFGLVVVALTAGCSGLGNESAEDISRALRREIVSGAEKFAADLGAKARTDSTAVSTFQGVVMGNVPLVDSSPNEMVLYFSSSASANCTAPVADGYYLVRVKDPEYAEQAELVDINGDVVAHVPLTYGVHEEEATEEDEGKVLACVSMHSERGAKARSVALGTTKCQWIFPFSWRHLHTVIVIT